MDVFVKRCSRRETSWGVGTLERGLGSRFSSKRLERIIDALCRLMSSNTTDLTALQLTLSAAEERLIV